MKIVVDFNILFSALLKRPNNFAQFIFLSDNIFYAPLYVRYEFFKHQEKLSKITSLSHSELNEMFSLLLENIHLIDEQLITIDSRQQAYDLCKGLDEFDIPYVALAIELKANLWTGDKKLISDLNKKGYTNFFSL